MMIIIIIIKLLIRTYFLPLMQERNSLKIKSKLYKKEKEAWYPQTLNYDLNDYYQSKSEEMFLSLYDELHI